MRKVIHKHFSCKYKNKYFLLFFHFLRKIFPSFKVRDIHEYTKEAIVVCLNKIWNKFFPLVKTRDRKLKTSISLQKKDR